MKTMSKYLLSLSIVFSLFCSNVCAISRVAPIKWCRSDEQTNTLPISGILATLNHEICATIYLNSDGTVQSYEIYKDNLTTSNPITILHSNTTVYKNNPYELFFYTIATASNVPLADSTTFEFTYTFSSSPMR